jgi:mannose-6-phosphate isomerase-like protein (cupin superfamily)
MGLRSVVAAALFGVSGLAFADAVHDYDAVAAAADHHKVLLENDAVRVLQTRIGPGERTPVHAHPWPAAMYVVSYSEFVRHAPDGAVLLDSRTLTIPPKPGSALWSGPLPPHYIENVGKNELVVIAVELTPAPAPEPETPEPGT